MFSEPLLLKTLTHRARHICFKDVIPVIWHSHLARTLFTTCFFLTGLSLFFACNTYATDSLSQTSGPYVFDDRTYFKIPSTEGFVEKGMASWYGPPFHGRTTANGECYNMYSLTAAHKTLPMGTILMVKNLENGKNTFVRVNDRGPFIDGRIIDLSYKAARALGVVGNGTAKVQIIALVEGEVKNKGEAPTLYYQDFEVGEFYVQIGSFTQKNNAVRLQKRFADAGHTAVIHQSLTPGDIFYRVRVYVGKTLESARVAKNSLLKRGYAGAFVIAR